MSNKHGNSGSPQGVLALKPVGNTSTHLSVTGQTVLSSQNGDGTGASLFNDGTYDLTMSVQRNADGELTLNSSIVGVGNRPTVALAGDFNGDGFVNAADYVTWRQGGALLERHPTRCARAWKTIWPGNKTLATGQWRTFFRRS